jgi:hypothetical protein
VGFKFRNPFGVVQDTDNEYTLRDAYGNIVSSASPYAIRDANGNVFLSNTVFKVRDAYGNLVNSPGPILLRNAYGEVEEFSFTEVTPGPGPTNLVLPSIVGVAEVGQTVEWDVGIWDTATSFEIEVVITGGARDGEVVLTRRSIVGNDTGTIAADLTDQSITLKVWGINGIGETLATSAAFGPIVAGFVARGVLFDSTDRLNITGQNAAIGSDKITISFWFRHTGPNWNNVSSARLLEIAHASSNASLSIRTASSGRLSILVGNNANGSAARTTPTSPALVVDQWYHCAISIDRATQRFQIYIDRTPVSATAYNWTGVTSLFIESNWVGMGIASTAGGATLFGGDLAYVWIDYGTSLDLSDSANLDKFVASTGLPVDLGAKGELVTGSEPNFYFDGVPASWNNLVTGGPSFTVTGTLTASSSPPQF